MNWTTVFMVLFWLYAIGIIVDAVIDAAPEVFGDFFRWIGRVLNVPLVPKRKDGAA